MALDVLSLAGLIGFSQLIVLGIYLYRKGRKGHLKAEKTLKPLVQPKQTQKSPALQNHANGKSKASDIARKALDFFKGDGQASSGDEEHEKDMETVL
jgi:hypothetical protein